MIKYQLVKMSITLVHMYDTHTHTHIYTLRMHATKHTHTHTNSRARKHSRALVYKGRRGRDVAATCGVI